MRIPAPTLGLLAGDSARVCRLQLDHRHQRNAELYRGRKHPGPRTGQPHHRLRRSVSRNGALPGAAVGAHHHSASNWELRVPLHPARSTGRERQPPSADGRELHHHRPNRPERPLQPPGPFGQCRRGAGGYVVLATAARPTLRAARHRLALRLDGRRQLGPQLFGRLSTTPKLPANTPSPPASCPAPQRSPTPEPASCAPVGRLTAAPASSPEFAGRGGALTTGQDRLPEGRHRESRWDGPRRAFSPGLCSSF